MRFGAMLAGNQGEVLMLKLAAAIAGLLMLVAPAAVSAKDKTAESRAQALLACAAVADDQARLRCYDETAVAMKQALDQDGLVLTERTKPRGREGIVKSAGYLGGNRYWVELDTGDRWQLVPTTERKGPPETGVRVKVDRGPLGNYWFSAPGWPVSPAKYMRRRP
jgi:hypothetical protein